MRILLLNEGTESIFDFDANDLLQSDNEALGEFFREKIESNKLTDEHTNKCNGCALCEF